MMGGEDADRLIQISVVIPAYRARSFIGRAIDSALSQTGVSLEVLVVDDASPDDTAGLVTARYADRPAVRVIQLPRNGGPSVARNAGFAAARGAWIAVLDADDAFEDGRLERLAAAGDRHHADIIADNVRFFDAEQGTLGEPALRSRSTGDCLDIHALAAGGRPMTGELDFGLLKPLFRRSFMQEKRLAYPPAIRHGEDFMLYFDAIMAGARFVFVAEAGYRWTLRNSGNSRTRVDYLGQARDARALQQRSDVRDDARLVALLEARARALTSWHVRTGYRDAVRRRDYRQALLACVQHPWLLRSIAGGALRRLR